MNEYYPVNTDLPEEMRKKNCIRINAGDAYATIFSPLLSMILY